MENNILKHTLRFIIFIAIQVLVLNHIQLNGYINPYLYVMFILLLPFDTKGWTLLLAGFGIGLTIDMFSNSVGMHAAACVFLAFFRPFVISLITIKKDFEGGSEPRLSNMGSGWIFLYSTILVSIHHLSLFLLEVFRFEEILHTLSRTIFSAVFTLALIMLTHFLMSKPQKTKSMVR
jgi:rod shape-determining protein MreD